MSLTGRTFYEFGPFRLNPKERLLLRDSQPVPLPPKAYDLLVSLVAHAGRLMTKDDLLKEVWPGTFVEEANLSYTVSLLRKALGDDSEPHRYIETVPKRGYRFREPVIVAESSEGRTKLRGSTIAVAVIVVVGTCAALLWRAGRPHDRPARPEIRSVAILPLRNLSNDATQAYFVEGMHEAVITELARLGMPVVAHSSAMRYAGTDKPLATIARELDVQAIVEGSVLRSGPQVRISAQLVEVATGQAIWGAAFDRDLQDVLALQRDVAQAIGTQVLSAARHGPARPAAARSVDPDTYEAYLKGRYHLNRRREPDMLKAVEYFERAINRDPGYALAFSALADSLNLMPLYGSTAPRDAIPGARKAAAQAIALDDDLAEGHASLAWALLTYDWDWAAADRELLRAIDLNPNYETARMWYGLSLIWRGRFEEGIQQLQQARRLDPVGPWTLTNIAIATYLTRDYDRAIREQDAVVELENTLPAGYVWRGLAQLQKGLHHEAVRSLEQGLALGPERANRLARAGYVYGVTGQRERARAMLARITDISRSKYVPAVDFAIVHIGLGEKGKALDWLDRGIEEHGSEMMSIKTDPRFDLVRSEPRFQRLLQVMNFPN